jgi:membrane protein required for colicin V production
MNPFDAAILLIALIAMVAGFNAGLLRGLATIFAYAAAAPLAIGVSPWVAGVLYQGGQMPPEAIRYVTPAMFIVLGLVFSVVARIAVAGIAGERRSVIDRIAGALLGAVRIGLVAIVLVLVFDRMIPANREPAWLKGSQLRPWLSAVGASGVRALPPEAVAAIDRLKRERGI